MEIRKRKGNKKLAGSATSRFAFFSPNKFQIVSLYKKNQVPEERELRHIQEKEKVSTVK